MANLRKPFQGVFNIIRFNWHFYVLAFGFVLFLLGLKSVLNTSFHWMIELAAIVTVLTTVISLLVSYFVYDRSGLYNLDFISKDDSEKTIVNINAGFDETSVLLKQKYQNSNLIVLDFYDPKRHTEVSIKRARKAYPPFPDTKKIETDEIDLDSQSIDQVFLMLSAHEIRDTKERIIFFKELNRILKKSGEVVVVEHLRDIANLLAYNIGFFHFHSKGTWKQTYENSNFKIAEELKITPFISVFKLKKDGNTF